MTSSVSILLMILDSNGYKLLCKMCYLQNALQEYFLIDEDGV